MAKKKTSKEKRRGDRRTVDRRSGRRRLKKEPPQKNHRGSAARRQGNRRGAVRRESDTYLAKIKEFKALAKTGDALPPLEEEVITDAREIVDGFETSASEDAPESTDPAPESENN